MGARGTRNNKTTTTAAAYQEPTLLVDIADLLKQAEENGCYDGDQLNIEKLVTCISNANPNDPLVLKYVTMDAATSGSLQLCDGIWTIKVNKNHNVRRQRFTIAHELGHYMMHRNKSTLFNDEIFFRSEKRNSIEYVANDFASQLLLPQDKVVKAISEGVRNIGMLAERFNVSSPAMKVRVQELGYKLKQND